MKLSTTLSVLSLLTASAAASNLFQQLAGSTTVIKVSGGSVIPGDSPLQHCGDTGGDILSINKIDLTPNPPIPGKPLLIEASGTLKNRIETGAYVNVIVKYGMITLIHERLDLCEHAGEVDLKCPVDSGKMNLTKTVELPSQIPPGKYTVSADAYTEGNDHITCVMATIAFTIR